ncbi:Rab family GTPase [Polaribacter dokdonensis]|jgi:small GTP-binding protein|uniref:Ras family protein n=1 Tax=Polaribacter dokdonensis DSW-5 TaxID=1300348 RepID=A0A0M9CI60_9FLAO|nr:Rab family GTPase [Polaribacter dokdonensis]KOY52936.1 Ras family protein [Polaribacter dokdonensis DSW-5]SEE54710.1 small GTP-binding protein domain-containing protein [Polaribacter dokdonensis DSW-5]
MIAKKVLLVGNFGVGKTSLIRRFVLNEFSEDYISTIGVRVSTKILNVEEEEMKLLIWDVAGTSDDEKIPKAYFLGASAAMYVFDLNREETYINVDAKIQELKDISGLDTILLVGNKKDLLSEERIEEIRATCPLPINAITSAKDNDSVEEAFREIVVQSLK